MMEEESLNRMSFQTVLSMEKILLIKQENDCLQDKEVFICVVTLSNCKYIVAVLYSIKTYGQQRGQQ